MRRPGIAGDMIMTSAGHMEQRRGFYVRLVSRKAS